METWWVLVFHTGLCLHPFSRDGAKQGDPQNNSHHILLCIISTCFLSSLPQDLSSMLYFPFPMPNSWACQCPPQILLSSAQGSGWPKRLLASRLKVGPWRGRSHKQEGKEEAEGFYGLMMGTGVHISSIVIRFYSYDYFFQTPLLLDDMEGLDTGYFLKLEKMSLSSKEN